MIPFSAGPAVHAAGPALAAALPAGMSRKWRARLAAVLATDLAARRFGRPGITIIGITPGPRKESRRPSSTPPTRSARTHDHRRGGAGLCAVNRGTR
jgi:hypothetical protein